MDSFVENFFLGLTIGAACIFWLMAVTNRLGKAAKEIAVAVFYALAAATLITILALFAAGLLS